LGRNSAWKLAAQRTCLGWHDDECRPELRPRRQRNSFLEDNPKTSRIVVAGLVTLAIPGERRRATFTFRQAPFLR
jgi:hypothetical protein